MDKRTNKGIRRLWHAWHYSIDGLKSAFKHEEAFRQETLLAVVLIPLALWLGSSAIERALLIGTIFLLLIVELINTAVESVVDRIGPEHHLLSKRAKDACSAAVLIAVINLCFVWLSILFYSS